MSSGIDYTYTLHTKNTHMLQMNLHSLYNNFIAERISVRQANPGPYLGQYVHTYVVSRFKKSISHAPISRDLS